MVHLCAPLTLVLSVASAVLAAPVKECIKSVKESVPSPNGWVQGRPAPADHVLELRIALPQPNFHVLEQHLYEVSDPDHNRYGQHLSKEEVENLISPSTDSVRAVDEWLSSHGLKTTSISRSPAKDWVVVKVPVGLAEAMLDTTYHIWTHEASGDSVVRTLSYSLPEDLHAHVELIQPTTMFARMKRHSTTYQWQPKPVHAVKTTSLPPKPIALSSGIKVDGSCNETITVSCLKQLYNAVGYKSSATNGNQIGITGYLDQFANIADLQQFYADQRPDALGTTFKYISVNGGQNSQNLSQAGPEADLDVQFGFGMTFPTSRTFYSTGGSPPFIPDLGTPSNTNEPYAEWLDFVLSQPNVPQTISTSYGDHEQTDPRAYIQYLVPLSYAERICSGFAQLGARGVSLLFASGDGGVGDNNADPATQQCFTNHGKNVTRFIPAFPASCPFVTAVGGTVHIPEIAVDFSGGGFSNYFPRPSYQDNAAKKYLQKLPKDIYKGLFNPNGRGIPDVAAEGLNYRIFFRGQAVSIGGTSASSPTFAGIVTLLNDARISAGKPPLGFLNPFLYSRGVNGLTDITFGNNPGCGTPGFNATSGWDPVTGLGTPNFAKLKALVV